MPTRESNSKRRSSRKSPAIMPVPGCSPMPSTLWAVPPTCPRRRWGTIRMLGRLWELWRAWRRQRPPHPLFGVSGALLMLPVAAFYVLIVYFASMVITGLTGHWWPARIAWPGVELAFGVVIVAALSLLGSIALSSIANGIAVFMLFGAGLVAGLLGTIGHALNSHAVKHASTIASWALPFEALYQDGLRMITENASGLTSFLLQLGPFGGAYVHGWPIRLWSFAYLLLVVAAAIFAFSRRDL